MPVVKGPWLSADEQRREARAKASRLGWARRRAAERAIPFPAERVTPPAERPEPATALPFMRWSRKPGGWSVVMPDDGSGQYRSSVRARAIADEFGIGLEAAVELVCAGASSESLCVPMDGHMHDSVPELYEAGAVTLLEVLMHCRYWDAV